MNEPFEINRVCSEELFRFELCDYFQSDFKWFVDYLGCFRSDGVVLIGVHLEVTISVGARGEGRLVLQILQAALPTNKLGPNRCPPQQFSQYLPSRTNSPLS